MDHLDHIVLGSGISMLSPKGDKMLDRIGGDASILPRLRGGSGFLLAGRF
ncbi:hypothetical protein [Mesorhizobium sp. A556]